MSQQETKGMAKHFYRASAADFMKIPGGPVAYWVQPNIAYIFSRAKAFGDIGRTRRGLQTGNSTMFVRNWWEVSYTNIGFSLSKKEAKESAKRWFVFNSGGQFRKWYGNLDDIVNWKADGQDIKATGRAIIPSESLYFKSAITWPKVSSGKCSFRWFPDGVIPGDAGPCFYDDSKLEDIVLCFSNSKVALSLLQILSPTLNFEVGVMAKMPILNPGSDQVKRIRDELVGIHRLDWNEYETSWGFSEEPLVTKGSSCNSIEESLRKLESHWDDLVDRAQQIESFNNELFITLYGLNDELEANVPVEEITLSCNPLHRYGPVRGSEQGYYLRRCDTVTELLSYALGCMVGRYSIDKPGLILASQGETLKDYLCQIPSPRFNPDDDAILPLTDQEWFADDATNRFREFVRVVWGDEYLQENLDFVAESLCLHAIKPKRGESAMDTIRRYLSTQFFKDHLRTYKKRPIYWLFSSGKHKAFECLVYLHRYNEGTLARMRTEYVIPLSAKLNAYAEKLEQDNEASTSAAETKRLEKEIATLHKQQAELAEFDEKLRHYADQRISLDLDDGVKVNYGKFGDLLAEVKAVTGQK